MSDGVLPPAEVAARAHANGVQLWALTDHDVLSGLNEASDVARSLGMRFVTGVEISVTWANQTVHIVGLGIDARNIVLQDGLGYIRTGRLARARQIADKLTEMGIPDSYEGALPYATNPNLMSRTHFARFLIASGRCKSMKVVFDKYLGDGKPAHVPVQWATLDQAVGWIIGAGGHAVIAHPGRYGYTPLQFDALFERFKELGGVGIEVVTGSHAPHQYVEYASVARRFGFLASCGSDFHGPAESRLDLGSLPPLPAGLTPIWDLF
jgi:predicted metal-dependent phosphoesterase TrpH